MRRFTIVPIAIAASGIALIVAEEISLQIYLNAPCDMLCDKVIGRNPWRGMMLVIAGGIVFGVERVIRPQKAIRSSDM